MSDFSTEDMIVKCIEKRPSLEKKICFNEKEMKLLREILGNTRTEDCGDTHLHRAVSDGNENVVKLLIDIGVDIDEKDCDGNTALDFSRIFGNKAIEDILLKAVAKDERAIHKIS